jgi:flagellar hook-associated protein 3 FlgL
LRITSNGIRQETLSALRTGLSGMAEAQRRVASGRRIHVPSDDPVGAAGVLRSGRQIQALEQYGRNIDMAAARLRAEEQALEAVTNLLVRAKELGVGSLSGTGNTATALAYHDELEVLLTSVVEQANTRFGSGYLFGGATPDVRPFTGRGDVPEDARPAGQHAVDIGSSSWFATNHDGKEVFQDTGVFAALDALSTAVEAQDTAATADALTLVDEAFTAIQRRLSEVGARTNRLEIGRANVEALDLNLRVLRSDLQDAEIERAVSDLISREVAYQSALLATSKILSTTLSDYLR